MRPLEPPAGFCCCPGSYLACSPQTSTLAHTDVHPSLRSSSFSLLLGEPIPRLASPVARIVFWIFFFPLRARVRHDFTGDYLQTLGPARANPLDCTHHRRELGAKPISLLHLLTFTSTPWSATAATTRNPGCHRPTQPHMLTPGPNLQAPNLSLPRRSIPPASRRR